jgi:hypothetical protein
VTTMAASTGSPWARRACSWLTGAPAGSEGASPTGLPGRTSPGLGCAPCWMAPGPRGTGVGAAEAAIGGAATSTARSADRARPVPTERATDAPAAASP